MTFAEINNLTIEQTYLVLIPRILDLSVVPAGEPHVQLHENEELPFYERLLLHASLVKPSEQVFSNELDAYKQELTDAEQARLDEEARVNALQARFDALGDLRGAMGKLGKGDVNSKLEMKRIIEEDDTAALDALESADVDFQNDIEDRNANEQAKKILALINQCVKVVMKHNIKNQLSAAQKDQQKTDHAALFQHLADYRPGKFKSALDGVQPDGTIVKQDLKDELLALLASYGVS